VYGAVAVGAGRVASVAVAVAGEVGVDCVAREEGGDVVRRKVLEGPVPARDDEVDGAGGARRRGGGEVGLQPGEVGALGGEVARRQPGEVAVARILDRKSVV
jgi:hypothetical protein